MPDRIVELCNAFQASQVLLSAAQLGVFTALAQGPMDCRALANQLSIAERGARDFFDALVAIGMLQRDEKGQYGNGRESDAYLDRNKPNYIGDLLVHAGTRVYPQWGQLTQALRTGSPIAARAAEHLYSGRSDDPKSLEAFAKGMTAGSLLAAKAVAAKFPWQDYGTAIDIGTAQGCLPVQLASVHAHLRGGGFDLPQVRPLFESYVRGHGLSDRLTFYPGDFMTEPLPAADVLVMGRVLHNWDLSTRMMLLKKAYKALPVGGSLVIYERLIDEERRTNTAALLASLNMLVMTAGGGEFTGSECAAWLREVGFQESRLEPLVGQMHMIIAQK
jgi:hypothetical protein